ncbi:hypothetical protein DFP72DRAFT_1170057 [Ephemerocybe angulata]|uniref:F-box domain-containing protein n=1 Tax=Ephemerocybe angulata TaxID=980116 RepID=A0A8H6HXJ0_9AGAR|nr:hypothetical protein DFP72DRAFT_1170057 [Tulosesus angulatus]
MSTIQDLPSELKRAILLELGSQDLARVCRTSKEDCAEGDPLLYRSISINTNRPKSLGCLKTLHQNKKKALFVTSLALHLLEDDDALELETIGNALANTGNLTFLALNLSPELFDVDNTAAYLFVLDTLKLSGSRPEPFKHLRGLFTNVELLFLLDPLRDHCPNLKVVGLWDLADETDEEAATNFVSECSSPPLLFGLDFILEDDPAGRIGLSVTLFDSTLKAADLAAGLTPLTDFSLLGEEMRRDFMAEPDSTGSPPGASIDLNLTAHRLDAAELSRLAAVAEGMSGMFEYENTDNVSISYSEDGDIAWPELKALLSAFYPPPAPDQDPLGPVMLEITYIGAGDLSVSDATIATVVQVLNDPALARLTRKAASIDILDTLFEQTDGVWTALASFTVGIAS